MRALIAVLVLIFSLQSWTKAENISDFEIEGLSIYSNLLDQTEKLGVTKEFILKKKFKFYPNSKRIGLLRFKNRGTFEICFLTPVILAINGPSFSSSTS